VRENNPTILGYFEDWATNEDRGCLILRLRFQTMDKLKWVAP